MTGDVLVADALKSNSLATLRLFRGLDEDRLARIDQLCRRYTFYKDEQIIDREDSTRDVYFILSGSVRVVNYSISGREISFEDIQPGSLFGELAALDGAPRSANIVALTTTEVATMSPTAFQQMLAENPDIALQLMQRLAQVIRSSTERIMDLSTLGANNRVYAELVRLAHEGGEDEMGAVIKPIPIHGDIASRVSTTRETVARVLSDLTKKSLIKRKGNELRILDLDRLEEMVEDFRGI